MKGLQEQEHLQIEASELREDVETHKLDKGEVKVTNYEQVASFNWRGDPERPVMVVPGAPASLLDWQCGKVAPDTGQWQHVTDYNTYMFSRAPIEPALRALLVCHTCTVHVLINQLN